RNSSLKKCAFIVRILYGYSYTLKNVLSSTKCISPAPKIVFHRLNGKRFHRPSSPKAENTTEGFTPAHEENVRFVYEAWQEVEQKLGEGSQPENGKGPVQYAERSPNPGMKNFVPIDLEEWWAQRFLANIANLS
uniref:MAPK regulated corepressor interacting protein 2 n=1 Tax=Cyprinus carpio carpio TaxID=630221 RepID=A0A8C1F5E6_CYPCA